MSTILSKYGRVSEGHPCPKCGRPDWCLISHDGRKCVCTREKSGKRYGAAGWLHYLPEGIVPPKRERVERQYLTTEEVQNYLDYVSSNYNNQMLERQAQVLELSKSALRGMQARYDRDQAVTVFPMFNNRYEPVGCRFRRADGKKWSLKGGREGLFLSKWLDRRKPVFIAEGPTDSAALLEIGLRNTIGRPNCSGGVKYIQGILERFPLTQVVILADPDDPGIDGGIHLADALPNPCAVITGPSDVREFVSKNKVASKSRQAIIEAVEDYDGLRFRAVYHNNPGKFARFEL